MKEKVLSILGVVVWTTFFILLFKFNQMENKFWLGFLCGVLATLTIGGVIIVIIREEKRLKQ